VIRTAKRGRYTLLVRERTADRRERSWAGIGPAWEYGGGTKTVIGCAVHAGKHLVVLFWKQPVPPLRRTRQPGRGVVETPRDPAQRHSA
jgi:hypothetical protein